MTGFPGWLVVGALAAVLAAGCSSRRATQTPLVSDPAEPDPPADMNAATRREARAAFNSLVDGRESVDQPAAAESPRGRWSDVRLAVLYACDDAEMAVLAGTQVDGVWRYRLLTVEDWPATLTIERIAGPEVYRAAATVGLFDAHPNRVDALLKAFDKHMAAFGRKREFASEFDR